ETRNFQIRFCPRCGVVAVPGHVCGMAPAPAAATADAAPNATSVSPPFAASASTDDHTASAAQERSVPPSGPQRPPPLSPSNAKRQRRSIGQILLDPRSIRWLLGSGGALLVTGIVIWLASL